MIRKIQIIRTSSEEKESNIKNFILYSMLIIMCAFTQIL